MITQAILLFMIVGTALLTIFINVMSKPSYIKDGQVVKRISINDYNIAYDILSASFLTILYILSFTDKTKNLESTIGGITFNMGIPLLACFLMIVVLYMLLMKWVGWRNDSHSLSIGGVVTSMSFSVISLIFVFKFLIITGV